MELTESGNHGIAESRNGLSRLRDSATTRLRDQRGSALAAVLVLVVLLTMVGVAMVNSTFTEISVAYNAGDTAAAQYAAEAGLSRAMYELGQNPGWTGITAAIGTGQYVVTVTSSGLIRSITSNGSISGVTWASWAWTCSASASVRPMPELDVDSAATSSLKYRAQHTFDADGKYLYFKGGDTGRCNSGSPWTFTSTQQCWDYYVNSESGTLGSSITNPVFFIEFAAAESTNYTTGGGGNIAFRAISQPNGG